ncbi:MAG: hypothetical protein ABI442_12950 [Gemmatimonadaceae bacterium]
MAMLARRAWVGLTLVTIAASGCGDSTSPNAGPECGSAAVVTLAVNQATTRACGTGTLITLSGGAKYLIVPQFASGGLTSGIANTLVPYVLGAPSSVARTVAATSFPLFAEPAPRTRQQQLDSALRARATRAASGSAWLVAMTLRSAASSHSLAPAVPDLGSVRDFRVLVGANISTQTTGSATARLSYVGANVLLYIDTLAPKNGFTPAQLQSFGQYFDGTLYSIVVSAFGPPSDVDGNGHVIVLLSPAVNALSRSATCSTEGYVAGYFSGSDLGSTGSGSNHGEIFYTLVPDPVGTVSCAHTVTNLLSTVPATFLHELQHLVSFSQHVVIAGGAPEEGWLDEGLSIRAEELGSEYYEAKYPAPTGRASPTQLFPDSSQGFIQGLLSDSYSYLLKSDTASLTLHSDADGGFSWRGGDWLLAHWLGDLKGKKFFTALEQSKLTGLPNVAAAAGESFQSLFGDFSLSVWTDSIVGVSRGAVPTRDRFQTRNLRQMYQRVFLTNNTAPREFPVLPVALSATGSIAASMYPGTAAYYILDLTAAPGDVTIQFASPGGGGFSAKLNSQVSIYRLPDATTAASAAASWKGANASRYY